MTTLRSLLRRPHSIVLLLLFLRALTDPSTTQSGSGPDNSTNEQIAIKAVRENYPVSVWTDYEVTANEERNSCLRNSKLYVLRVKGMHPPIISLVVIGNDKIPYVFPEHKAYQYHDRFSKVIAKENLNIGKDTVLGYIKTILCLLDVRAFLVNGIDELRDLPDRIKQDIKRYASEVREPELHTEGNRTSVVFYGWHRHGILSKWRLEASPNGEILSLEVKDLATYKMGVL
jgi:hypothetical protein